MHTERGVTAKYTQVTEGLEFMNEGWAILEEAYNTKRSRYT